MDSFCQRVAAMGRPATATRERILEAAFTRFSHYGYRRTSMEDIAAEAGLSRAALYLQFRNKEEIFRSLSQALHDEALVNAEAALNAAAPLAERLQAAVVAKTLRFVEIAYGSPHGSELLDERVRLCGDVSAEFERRFEEMLTRVFRRAAQAGDVDLAAVGLSAVEAAELFSRAVSGLKGPGISADLYRRRCASMVRLFCSGLGAGDAPRVPVHPRRLRRTAKTARA